ncbi:hypothetical protein FKM82_031368 [Ascaphus truei]
MQKKKKSKGGGAMDIVVITFMYGVGQHVILPTRELICIRFQVPSLETVRACARGDGIIGGVLPSYRSLGVGPSHCIKHGILLNVVSVFSVDFSLGSRLDSTLPIRGWGVKTSPGASCSMGA